MKNLLKYDLKVMLHKKEFIVAFCAMMIFAVYALFRTICIATGAWWSDIFDWNDYYLTSAEFASIMDGRDQSWQYFTYIFSFLVVLPYSMSFISEFESGELSIILSKVSKRRYCISKIITCFIGNVIIILIPLLLNYIFCRFVYSGPSIRWQAGYKLHNYNNFITGARTIIAKYEVIPMASLFVNHPSLYLLIHILMISGFSGVFGAFLFCLSIIIKRYRAILFLPVFLFIRLTASLSKYCGLLAGNDSSFAYVDYSFMNYFEIGNTDSLSPYYLPVIILVIGLFCWGVITMACKTDHMILGEVKRIGKIRKEASD